MATHRQGGKTLTIRIPDLPSAPPSPTPNSKFRLRHGRYSWVEVGFVAVCLLCVGLVVSLRVFSFSNHSWSFQESNPFDVVGLSVKPSCVNREAVRALNRHLRPRTIHIVTNSQAKCDVFHSFARNVRCHLEDEMLPGVTLSSISSYLQRQYGAQPSTEHMGRQLGGWYMQQFIKLGAASAIPGISDYFLIWDLDMILLRPVQFMWQEGGPRGTVKTLVNIGGARARGYAASYKKLFGAELETAPDGSSFVTHWVVVHRPFMAHMLQQLSLSSNASDPNPDPHDSALDLDPHSRRPDPDPHSWVWRILGSLDPTLIDMGFSEYATYVSWVRQHHPESQAVARKRTWLRHPLGTGMVRLTRHLNRWGACCPTPLLLNLVRALGYTYTGYEVGHVAECRFNAPGQELSYGLGPSKSTS